MGVLTKIDLRPPKDIIHTLRNNDYPLPLGYIGIMCRTTEAIEAGIDIKKHLVVCLSPPLRVLIFFCFSVKKISFKRRN